ncbi:MAG TPA: hypothetical protein VN893_17480 [Bryobacteraceae bacterium]|nr:hypothetical protein [Bryobacteraceae bacterium]
MMNAMARNREQRWWQGLFAPVVVALAVPFALVALVSWALLWLCLHLAIWLWWNTRGRDVLFVYSDSPVWQAYIEQRFLPYLGRRAVVLNWSERNRWGVSLGSLAFRFFGGRREFNPLGVVFRPFRRTRTFRFWAAFRDMKHGRPELLQTVEQRFFDCIGVSRVRPPD